MVFQRQQNLSILFALMEILPESIFFPCEASLVDEWFELWPSEWMVVGSNPISGLSFVSQKQVLTLGLKFSDSTPLTHQ